jgi:hypothetical protein
MALHFLEQAGHPTYCPRLRERRELRGRKIETRPLLFLGYAFVEAAVARRPVGS